MGTWNVTKDVRPGVLGLRLEGVMADEEMEAFLVAHNKAVNAMKATGYHVFCDISALKPMSQRAADLMEQAKTHSSKQANFRGSAVLVSSTVVAMQHQRTSTTAGVMSTELISDDPAACWAHIANVRRTMGDALKAQSTPSTRG